MIGISCSSLLCDQCDPFNPLTPHSISFMTCGGTVSLNIQPSIGRWELCFSKLLKQLRPLCMLPISLFHLKYSSHLLYPHLQNPRGQPQVSSRISARDSKWDHFPFYFCSAWTGPRSTLSIFRLKYLLQGENAMCNFNC